MYTDKQEGLWLKHALELPFVGFQTICSEYVLILRVDWWTGALRMKQAPEMLGMSLKIKTTNKQKHKKS